jgi:hypothetical protein
MHISTGPHRLDNTVEYTQRACLTVDALARGILWKKEK